MAVFKLPLAFEDEDAAIAFQQWLIIVTDLEVKAAPFGPHWRVYFPKGVAVITPGAHGPSPHRSVNKPANYAQHGLFDLETCMNIGSLLAEKYDCDVTVVPVLSDAYGLNVPITVNATLAIKRATHRLGALQAGKKELAEEIWIRQVLAEPDADE